jgi:hypothetical protein
MKLTPEQMESRKEIVPSRFAWGLCVLGTLVSIGYFFVRYSLHDMRVGGMPWAISTAAVLLLVVVAVLIVHRPKVTATAILSGLLALFGAVLGAALGGFIFYIVAVSIRDLYVWSRNDLFGNPAGSTLRLPLRIAAILGVGGVLFGFREKFRAFYGLGEATAGLWVARQKIRATSDDIVITLLTASVYLIVRGLDNINVGLNDKDENKHDKCAIRIVNWLKKPWSPGPIQ